MGERALRRGAGLAVVAAVFCVAGGGAARCLEVSATPRAESGYQPNHARAPGYLGVMVTDLTDDQLGLYRLRESRGAVVVHVDHDAPAGKMGLRERDLVLQLNGTLLDGAEQLRHMLREMAPGRTVVVVINRDGQQMILTSQMADRDEVERRAAREHLSGGEPQAPATGLPTGDVVTTAGPGQSGPATTGGRYSRGFLGSLLPNPSYTGLMLEKMGPQLAGFFGVASGPGMLVKSVETNSPAAMAGIRAGDVIVRANSHAVASTSEWVKLVKEARGGPVSVVVVRDRAEKALTLMADGRRRSSVEAPAGAAPDADEVARLMPS